jgi:DNA ligase D
MAASRPDETRDGVALTNLDQPLFDGAGATKRDLVDYLDGVHEQILRELADRPLSVIRTTGGQAPFMQKNLPSYTPDWVARVELWAEASKRTVSYALCNDRRTLLWFANQRAVEYHATLVRAHDFSQPTHLVLDLDPPDATRFDLAITAARAVRAALQDTGLDGAVKTSGAKGLHVVVPVTAGVTLEHAAAATRALARRTELIAPDTTTTAFIKADRGGKVFVDATRTGGATVVAAYSPRARPGVPVSFPVAWDHLGEMTPADFTVHTAPGLIGSGDPWASALPAPQPIPEALIAEGLEIPIPRVAAMHEGRRRARARKDPS